TGKEFTRHVASELLPVAFSVTIVELPALPAKGDVSDWLAVGGTREQLLALVESAQPFIRDDLEEHVAAAVAGAEDEPEDDADTEPLTLPEAAWRGPFADYRAAMAGILEAPDSAHFASLWATAAARLRRRVWTYYAGTLYSNVYLVNFGTTGDSKTSAQRIGIGLCRRMGPPRFFAALEAPKPSGTG